MSNLLKSPALRYFGGKWKMSAQIIPHFTAHKLYVDVFGGGANILLSKPPSAKEVYNDLNIDVVNYFRQVRENTDALVRSLLLTPYAKDSFDEAQELSNDPIEAARRFFCKSWMGVGGAGIKHKSGFRKSFQADIRPEVNYQQAIEGIHVVAARFRGVMIENLGYQDIISQYDSKDTLFYCDPPYPKDTRTGNQRYKHEFDNQDHCQMIGMLNSCKGNVVLSTYESPLYSELLKGWGRRSFEVNTTGQKKRRELLYTKSIPINLFTA